MPIKVVDLPTEESVSDDDYLIIRDNLTGTTRRISREDFFLNPPIPDDAITTDMLADESVTKEKLAPDAKISVRTYSIDNPATLTPASDDYDMFAVNALAQPLTVAAPTGTPVDGQGMLFRIKDNGTARALTWNSVYRAIGVTMPTSTVSSKMLYVSVRYNTPSLKWDVLSIARES